MIYELRTYTLYPGKQGEYLKVQKELGRPIRGDRYGKLEGGWTTEIGTLNQYVHLWSFADAGERQRMRAELAKDKRWQEEYLPAIRPMIIRQDNMLLMPVDGVPFTPPSGGKHIYEIRSYRAHFQQLPAWVTIFKEILSARQEYSKIVGLWTADIGSLNTAVHMWAYDDLNHRAQVRSSVLQDPRWQEFLTKSTQLLLEMQSMVLNSTEPSPLQ